MTPEDAAEYLEMLSDWFEARSTGAFDKVEFTMSTGGRDRVVAKLRDIRLLLKPPHPITICNQPARHAPGCLCKMLSRTKPHDGSD